MQEATANAAHYTFHLWWGLLGAVALLGLMFIAGPYSEHIEFLPDAGPTWYYWKLPDPTMFSRLTAWVGYGLHQISLWCLIYWAQNQRPGYVKGLHPVNLIALAANAFFVVLHILQTRFWYDGLAQDTSVMASQGSVVLMLVMILIMENRRRGMFFGVRAPIAESVGAIVRR